MIRQTAQADGLYEGIATTLIWSPPPLFYRYAVFAWVAGALGVATVIHTTMPDQKVRYLGLLIGTLIGLATLALAHRRMSRTATNLLVIGAWVLTTVLAVINGGVRAPAAIAYPALTIMVGWLMGGRAAMLTTLLTALTVIGLVALESTGLLPTMRPTPPAMYGAVQIMLSLLSAILIIFLARAYKDRLDQLQHTNGHLAARTDEQKQTQEALESSLKDKVALLNEVHHRVKNNLQVITSLLRLEAGRSTQPDTRSVLKDMQGRIRSMALLHESLYRSGTFAGVDLGHYLQQLATQAFRSMAPQDGSVRLQLVMASVKVTMDQATPCGLLLNELMSNSLKHGFPDGLHGEVHVELQPVPGTSQVQLLVSDTGVGLGVGFTLLGKKTLGLQLVSDLVRQIAGRIEIGSGPGAVLIVSFQPDTPISQSTRDLVHAQHHTVA
jgi:two-component sensor histidine kinase